MSKKRDCTNQNEDLTSADRRRLMKAKVRADKCGRTISDGYVPTGENDVFSYFASVGLGQVAYMVAVREVDASDIDEVSNYWFRLVDSTVDGASRAMDAGELPEFGGASIIGGLHETLRADYADIEPLTMLRLITAFAGVCISEFRDLGYGVSEDPDRFFVVRSTRAA